MRGRWRVFWIAFWIAVGGCVIAWACISLMWSWADEVGTDALREAVQEHGALGEFVEWIQLLGVVIGVTAGLASAVAAWSSLGSWSDRVAGFFASVFVALMSAVTFGAWI